MKNLAYRGGWNKARVADYLLCDTDYVAWEVRDDGPPIWIDADGREFQMMDDDDARWLATWKFVADRKSVSRDELIKEFAEGI